MFSATRRWFRRNRTPLAVGVGIVGAGYVVTQYVLSKINDARERMSSERIAKENLRRRFEQNQEDCTFTVLALLPTATTNILEAMNTEKITYEIQQMKGGVARSAKSVSGESAGAPSIGETTLTEDDGRSMLSMQSESGVHASQITVPGAAAAGNGAQEEVQAAAQAAAQKRKTKRQLWDDLTISSITRAYTLIYTLGLLTMLTRIQLNLLGRRNYLSSVISLATGNARATISLENNDDDSLDPSAVGNDFDVNRKYLTFSWWLLNRGWADVRERVEAAVREVFGHLSPRDQLSFQKFSDLTRQLRDKIERDPSSEPTNWLRFLLPPQDMEPYVLQESGILGDSAATHDQGPTAATSTTTTTTTTTTTVASSAALRKLLDETSDLIESPTFSHVLTGLLDAGFSALVDKRLAPAAFDLPTPPAEGNPELSRLRRDRTVLLPKVLSVLTRQAHVIGNGMPNEYLQEMEAVQDLEGFAAVVYSSNWETEVVQDEGMMASAVHVKSQQHQSSKTPVPAAAASPAVGESQPSGTESVVVVDPTQSSFESAWEKATEQK